MLPADVPQQVAAATSAIKSRRYADALDALGALRGSNTPRVKLAYEEFETAYGEVRKKPVGITLEGTDWSMPLKERNSTVMSKSEWENEARIAEAGEMSEPVEDWKAALRAGKKMPHPASEAGKEMDWSGEVTVVVRNTRGGPLKGVNSSGPGRTGPPDLEADNNTVTNQANQAKEDVFSHAAA